MKSTQIVLWYLTGTYFLLASLTSLYWFQQNYDQMKVRFYVLSFGLGWLWFVGYCLYGLMRLFMRRWL